MRVSIIIPVFNSELLLSDTLQSILDQTYLDWECIVVDDGSTDDTQKIVNIFKSKNVNFKSFQRPKHLPKGPSSSRNFGLKQAKGDFIIFLDSDDLLSPFCLEKRLDFVKQNPAFDFWIFKMNTFSEKDDKQHIFNILPPSLGPEDEFYKRAFLVGKFPYQTSCPLWKVSSLQTLKGFDEKMNLLEDPDIHLRAYIEKMKSKTAVSYDADCFYRLKEQITPISKERLLKIIHANLYFIDKHNHIDNAISYANFKRVFNTFVIPYKYFRHFSTVISFGRKKRFIGFKLQVVYWLLYLYNITTLHTYTNFGYHKLRKMTK